MTFLLSDLQPPPDCYAHGLTADSVDSVDLRHDPRVLPAVRINLIWHTPDGETYARRYALRESTP